MERSDGEIIAASLERPNEFEEVFTRYYQQIRRYLASRLGPDLAEELAAQTFLVAFERRSTYDPAYTGAKPWLFAIATNLLRHHVRDERLHLEILARRGPQDEVIDGPEVERLEALRLRPVLSEALSELSQGDRDALLLFAVAELTYEEIAGVLAIPTGTVRSRISRARLRLREHLPPLRVINEVTDEGLTDG